MRESLFGQVALEMGLVTEEELATSLSRQQAIAAESGRAPPLGCVLEGLGLITAEQVLTVLEEQEARAVRRIEVGGDGENGDETRRFTLFGPGQAPPFVVRLDTPAPPHRAEREDAGRGDPPAP